MSHWKQAVFIPQHENNQLDNIRYLQKKKKSILDLPEKKEKKYTQEYKKRKLRRL